MEQRNHIQTISRRHFVRQTVLGLGITWTGPNVFGGLAAAESSGKPLLFGVVTDVHYADAETRGTRHYRDSIGKLQKAIETFNKLNLAFVIELGDFVDAGGSKEDELAYLQTIDKVYQGFRGDQHYVLGNHCLNAFTKKEFLAACGSKSKHSYYSFDCGGYHFVVLDANFKRDGSPYANGNFSWTDTSIPKPEQEWLKSDLAAAGDKKTIAFLHHNLHDEKNAHGVKNAPEVRRILEEAGNVVAVFQGHDHSGGCVKIGGVHYCTLKAMVEGPAPENNSYAVVALDTAGGIRLDGFGRQKDVAFE